MSNQNDFVIENGVLKKYVGPGGDVIVPEGITSIGNCAFSGCPYLKRITLPESVTSIGYMAFYGCANLQDVSFPESVTDIGWKAFHECPRLAARNDMVILNGMLLCYYGSDEQIVIPEGVTSIGASAFNKCANLQSVTLPKSLKSIGVAAFSECFNLIDITIPEDTTSIGASAFSGCAKLKNIMLPERVKTIGMSAFSQCVSLQSVTLPVGLMEIQDDVFRDCGEFDLTIREWTSALTKAVKGCKLKALHTEDISKVPAAYRPAAVLGFVLDEPTDLASERAVSHMAYLKRNAGKLVGLACKQPMLLHFLIEHKLIKAKDVDVFMTEVSKNGSPAEMAALLNYQNELGMDKINKAQEKKEKEVDQVFDRAIARAQRSPNDGIAGLTFVVTGKLSEGIWESRKKVKEYLESYGAKLGSGITKQTDYLVTNNTNGNSEKTRKAKELGVEVISEQDFNAMIGRRFKNEKQITVPLWVKNIGDQAFARRNKLQSVTLPEGVTSLGYLAFGWCGSLQSITLPVSVTSIGDGAFAWCVKMQSIKLSENVIAIGRSAFQECSNLTVYAPAGSYAEQYAKENNIPFVAE